MSFGFFASVGARASSLIDPLGSSAILAATQWMSGTLLGSLATTIAVIAIGWVGLMMLSGRIDLRRGLTVVLGCFILFGAPTIAKGLRGFGNGAVDEASNNSSLGPVPSPIKPVPPPSLANSYDPYAGASLTP
ncbi:TrbC/VirB2 family protein [Rhizorhapis suberifaciens]|uniref:Type IV secretory pathway VirB2 component (Pilin) n=1 Tax=Rhizorhapis suberifaciens TaxID=13656 RepID=A0A840HWX6_9SPHN|nr:TrbC/VirB2 family protein [Rhizorhapis suberifaciens]MBB4642585.1 type IV secretory pathway VirB2 component (pilin) [Rhizorhapis suberifaciens]